MLYINSLRTRGVAFELIPLLVEATLLRRGCGGGGGEKGRGGRFLAHFLLPLYPCPVYFILEIRAEASTGNTESDLKSPSPASLSDRSVILKRITYHKLIFLSEHVSKIEMN